MELILAMALLDASRQAWLAVPGGSRHDIESSGSSASLLHSIYGSQASQLPISEYSSETSWGKSQTDLAGTKSLAGLPRRAGRARPMSSPASVLAARQTQRRVISSVLIESPLGGSQTSLEGVEKATIPHREAPPAQVVPRRVARPYSAAVSSSSSSRDLLQHPPSAWGASRRPQTARAPDARILSRPQRASVSHSSSTTLLPQCRHGRPSTTTFHRKSARPRTALATTVCIILRIGPGRVWWSLALLLHSIFCYDLSMNFLFYLL